MFSVSWFTVARESTSMVVGVTVLTVTGQMASGSVRVSSPKKSPPPSMPTLVVSPYSPVPILESLPCTISSTWSMGLPNSATTVPGGRSRCSKRPATVARISSSSKPRSSGSSCSSSGMTRADGPLMMYSTSP